MFDLQEVSRETSHATGFKPTPPNLPLSGEEPTGRCWFALACSDCLPKISLTWVDWARAYVSMSDDVYGCRCDYFDLHFFKHALP